MYDQRAVRADRRLPGLIVAALLVRLLLPAAAFVVRGSVDAFKSGDSREYLRLAASLAGDQRYYRATGPELYRPPG